MNVRKYIGGEMDIAYNLPSPSPRARQFTVWSCVSNVTHGFKSRAHDECKCVTTTMMCLNKLTNLWTQAGKHSMMHPFTQWLLTNFKKAQRALLLDFKFMARTCECRDKEELVSTVRLTHIENALYTCDVQGCVDGRPNHNPCLCGHPDSFH